MNRSALQFSLRAFFVAGMFCALFCVFCAYAMYFCWDLKNMCRLQIQEIRYLRECVDDEMRRNQAIMDAISADTLQYARTAKHMRDEAKACFDGMQAASNVKEDE